MWKNSDHVRIVLWKCLDLTCESLHNTSALAFDDRNQKLGNILGVSVIVQFSKLLNGCLAQSDFAQAPNLLHRIIDDGIFVPTVLQEVQELVHACRNICQLVVSLVSLATRTHTMDLRSGVQKL